MKKKLIICVAVVAIIAAGVGIFALVSFSQKPNPPKNVAAENITAGVKLSWSAEHDVKYNVYRDSTLIKQEAESSFTDKKAASGKACTYEVRAVKNSNMSEGATVKITRLAVPEITSAENAESSVTIKWKSVKGAAKYVIYKKSKSGYKKLAATPKTNCEDNAVKSGAKLSYKVRAVAKDKSRSAFSNVKSSYFLDAPTLDSDNIKTDNGVVNLSWKAVAGAESYAIFKTENVEADDFEIVGTTKETGFSESFDDIAVVKYIVCAMKSDSVSAPSHAMAYVTVGERLSDMQAEADSEPSVAVSDGDLSVRLGVGESFTRGSAAISALEAAKLADSSISYGIDVVSGSDVISVNNGVITALKPGQAQIRVTLSDSAIEYINKHLASIGQSVGAVSGTTLVNVTVE